jgi:phage gp46-like protein
MRDRQSRLLVAGFLTLGLFAAPISGHDATASAAQPEAQPLVRPVGGPIVPVLPSVEEPKAKLTLNPAAHTVVASFGTSYARRAAVLEQREPTKEGASPAEWAPVADSKKLDSKGRATFATDVSASDSYRVSLDAAALRPPVYSPAATLADQWDSTFSDQFHADALDDEWWSDRAVGAQMPSRLCSLPSAKSTVRFVEDGEFNAGITRHTDDEYFTTVVAKANKLAKARLKHDLAAAKHRGTKHKRRVAIAKAKAQYKLTHNCPRGAFENSIVSTQANKPEFRVNTAQPGIVAARVKFPKAQGMHTGIWLQSYARGGGEIDIAETFGFGSGLVNYLHIPSTGKMYRPGNPKALKRKGGRVIFSKTRSKAWWNDYHDVSVEWTATKFVFRTDGAVTKTIKLKPGKADYYLILSLLSSDWELPRLNKPIGNVKPITDVSDQKLVVDWVRIWSKHS